MDHTTINTFIIGLIVLLAGSLSFMAKGWMKDVRVSIDKFIIALDKLSAIITTVEKDQNRLTFRIEGVEKDFSRLIIHFEKELEKWAKERDEMKEQFGRRSTDACDAPDCPFTKTSPALRIHSVNVSETFLGGPLPNIDRRD